MAIFTPRGLKIRIAVPYAFGLMARLNPNVTPFRILKTTEGIESIPGMFSFAAAIIAIAIHLPTFQIAIVVAAAQIAGTLITTLGLYIIPGLVSLGTLFSYISGYGIYLIVVIIAGFILGGWKAVVSFFAGKIIAALVGLVIEHLQTRRLHKLTGHAFTASERNFFNAYRLHATRSGITTDISLSDDELEESHWGTTFYNFEMEWPEIAQRFTTD